MAFPLKIKFSDLKERNDEWKGDFWRTCRALYAGGPTLLADEEILRKVMPKHNAEDDRIYKERLSRAFYIPYPGSIIDKIVAELTGKPIIVERAPVTQELHENGSKSVEQDESPLPDFYKLFFDDCSKPGGKKTSINQLAREQILTALQCQAAWTLVDLPRLAPESYASLLEQEKAGALRAYACPIAPENVIDWECDESGEFKFVLIQVISCKRDGLTSKRNMVKISWTYYTPDEWALYELEYDKKKNPGGPTDRMEATLKAEGVHTFGRVPVRRLCLSEGLWAMGKLEAMARAHLNQRNALSWAQLKSMFPVPILYAANPNPLDPLTEDAGRAQQRVGPGYLMVLAEKDKMEYFSPDISTYEAAASDLASIRDEMHRVLHHMAMSVDNTGAALGRSAESKSIDQVAASVLLKALGTIVREHIEDIYQTVTAGRQEKESVSVSAKGMDTFEDTTMSQIIADALTVESINIPSATLQRKWKLKVAKTILGADATPEEVETIEDELEEAITQDSLEQLLTDPLQAPPSAPVKKGAPPAKKKSDVPPTKATKKIKPKK